MADDDFSTGAELELTVSQSSLSEARDTIESELGDLEVGVDAVVSGGGGGGMRADGGSGMDSLVQIENERWELDKLRNDYLEQIAEGGGVGGAGGGVGGLAGGLRAAAGGVSAGGAVAGGSLASIFGLNAAFGERSNTDIIASSAMQNIGNPAGAVGDIGSKLGSSIAEGMAEEFDWPELPDLSEEVDWPDVPNLSTETEWPSLPELESPGWLDELTITQEQRQRGAEARNRERDASRIQSRQFSAEDVNLTQEQRATGNQAEQREQEASRLASRGVTVDNSVDVSVESRRDDSEIVDEVMDRVERDVMQPLRRELGQGLSGGGYDI